jgi:hypothetical protein
MDDEGIKQTDHRVERRYWPGLLGREGNFGMPNHDIIRVLGSTALLGQKCEWLPDL